MKKNHHSPLFRFILLLLIISFIVPTVAQAAESDASRASYYLDSYNTYIYPAAYGEIQVWFTVTGVQYMDEIGTLSIALFESTDQKNWTHIRTYTHDVTSGMLGFDKFYHSGHVTHVGTVGRYYKAYVCIWAGKDGSGDTRYMWTLPKKASLFAT